MTDDFTRRAWRCAVAFALALPLCVSAQEWPKKTLTLVVDNPGSVVLTNSGVPGVNFALGGAITLSFKGQGIRPRNSPLSAHGIGRLPCSMLRISASETALNALSFIFGAGFMACP